MKDVKELRSKFVVEEWMDVYRSNGVTNPDSGYKVNEYAFEYREGVLYISKERSREKQFKVLHTKETLANLAKEERIVAVPISIEGGIPFNIYNPRIHIEND